MALVVAAGVWLAVIGLWELVFFAALIVVAWPVAEYVVDRDRDLSEAGSEHTAPPAGLDGRPWS